MKRRTITPAEYERVSVMLTELTELLLEVGIVELRISKEKEEIFWDTEHKGKVSPDALEAFAALIEGHYEQRLERTVDATQAKRRRRA